MHVFLCVKSGSLEEVHVCSVRVYWQDLGREAFLRSRALGCPSCPSLPPPASNLDVLSSTGQLENHDSWVRGNFRQMVMTHNVGPCVCESPWNTWGQGKG